jgi:tetratricopeptide (TPR) repeat protein
VIRPAIQRSTAAAAPERPESLLAGDAWLERLREVENSAELGRLGRFQVLSEIGRGGQGVVYRALDPDSGDVVAVKRLHPARGDRREVLHQIETEVRAVGALSHPNVVRTRGVEMDGAHSLLVMDWVDGVPLTEWASPAGDRRSDREIVALVARVAEILAHAHERGVIHRDLKPTNVLVDAAGQPHLLDFGLARLDLETSMTTAASTRFVGTLAYAPPELVEKGSGAIDARSDLYSLGVTFYEMVEGRPPCDLGQSISSAVQAILHAEPRPLTGPLRDTRLEAVLRRLLAKLPDDRYASAGELLDDLQRWLRGDRLSPAATTAGRKAVRRRWRKPAALAGAALALAFAAVVSGSAWDRQRRAADASAPERATRTLRSAGLNSSEAAPWNSYDADQVLGRVSQAVSMELRGDPRAEIAARLALVENFAGLGLWPEAARESRRASALIESRGEKGGAMHAAAAAMLAASDQGPVDPAGALVRIREAAASIPPERLAQADWMNALSSYARDRRARGQTAQVIGTVTRASDLVRRLPSAPPATRARMFELRGEMMTELELWPAAERAYREAIAEREGTMDAGLPAAWSNLGSSLLRQGRSSEAIEHYREAAALRCEFLFRRSPEAREFLAMAAALRRDGLDGTRLLALGRVLDLWAPEFGPALLVTARRYAEAEERLGHSAEAEGLREAIRVLQPKAPAANPRS